MVAFNLMPEGRNVYAKPATAIGTMLYEERHP